MNSVFYFLMFVFVIVCVKQGITHDLDFQVFYNVGQQFISGDYRFYKIEPYPGWPYRYGPIFPPLMVPFAWLSKESAQAVWSVLNGLALPLTWYLSEQILVPRAGEIVRSPLVRILTLFAMLDYFSRNATQGNINLFMALSLIGGVYLSDRKKPFFAALAIGIGVAVKVYSGAAALYFLLTRRWSDFIWSVICSVFLMFIVPIIIYGPRTTNNLFLTWAQMLQDKTTYPFLKYINQSPLAVFTRITGSESAAAALTAIFILFVFCGLTFFVYKKQNNNSLELQTKFDLMILLSCVSLPLTILSCVYTEYHVIALPIYLVANAYLIHGFLSKSWVVIYWIRFSLVHLAVLAIVGRPLTEQIGAMGNHLFGIIVFLLLIYFTVQKLNFKANVKHA